MTQTSRDRVPVAETGHPKESTAWTGWIVFAGVLLATVGSFQVIQGLVALFHNGFYLVRPSGLVVDVNYNTWGWTHLIIGAVMIVTGLGLFVGNMAARVVGVAVAVLSAIVNLGFISAYPIWSAIIIALDVVVIYAIIVHGGELRERSR